MFTDAKRCKSSYSHKRQWKRSSRAIMLSLLLLPVSANLNSSSAYDYVGKAITGHNPARGERVVKVTWQYKLNYVRLEKSGFSGLQNRNETETPVGAVSRETIDAQFISSFLSRLKLYRRNKKPLQLFSKKDIKLLTVPLLNALKQSTSSQDVVFGIAGRSSGFSLFSESLYTTGRLFIHGDQLNLILGDTLKRFEGEVRVAGNMPRIAQPLRRRQADMRVHLIETPSISQVGGRPDWVRFQLETIDTDTLSSQNLTPSNRRENARSTSQKSETPRAVGKDIRGKLVTLKQLWKEGLITDNDYKEFRRSLLKQL